MPIYQVTTKLLGTILVEAEMQGDVYETINKDQITSLVTYTHKEDVSKKKITLESELAELLETDSMTLWSVDNFFCCEYGGLVYTAESIIGAFDKVLKKSIDWTPENLEISHLIHHILKEFPTTPIKLSMKNHDYFKAASQGTWVTNRTIKGALVNMYDNILIKQVKN